MTQSHAVDATAEAKHVLVCLNVVVQQLLQPVVGRAVEIADAWPEKVNAEFVDVVDRTHARRRVFTLRCLDARREAAFSFPSCNL